MIFIINYKDQSSTLLSATTWSDAATYVEGIGKDISSINQPTYATLVLNSPLSNNFYQLFVKNSITGVNTVYFVFEENYQSLITWVESLGNSEITQLTQEERNYVSL
jgi:hypothetical protein